MDSQKIKHTPKPWAFGFDDDEVSHVVYAPDNGVGTRYIATGICQGNDDGEADAKLIAAAPDLLEACQEFVRKVESGEAKSKRSYKQMKEAISKATD